jgi:transcriptional regulator with XRE-family HTH domain
VVVRVSEQEDGAVPDWDLADRMRKALRHADLGVGEMADYLGVSRTSVSNWINGRVAPSLQTLRLWALRTSTDLDWLLGRPLVLTGVPGRGFTNGSLCAPRADLRLVA